MMTNTGVQGVLEACPFCDEQPSFTDVELKDERRYAEKLLRCCSIEMSATLSFSQYKGLTDAQIDHKLRSELVKVWNTRAATTAPAKGDEPAFNAMIANLIGLDKQRTPGPWKKTHDNVTSSDRALDARLVARCDTDWGGGWKHDAVKGAKNARFIVALENAWPKILAALAHPSSDRPASAQDGRTTK